MMLTDLLSAVKSALEENKDVPAALDAFGQFLDNPTDWLRLNYDLPPTFVYIQENLAARFTEAVAKRAATIARNHIGTSQQLCGGNMDRLTSCLRSELKHYHEVVVSSIIRRFANLSPSERRAVDAVLRLVRRRKWLFQTNTNESVLKSEEFERFYAAVKAESPKMEPLRLANLLIEKGLFNRLLLQTKNQNYNAFVPSLYVTENAVSIITKVSSGTEHSLQGYLAELRQSGSLASLRPFLHELIRSDGVLEASSKQQFPSELSDYLTKHSKFLAISPVDLEDIQLSLQQLEREEGQERKQKEIAPMEMQSRQAQVLPKNPESETTTVTSPARVPGQVPTGAIYLGEELDIDNFLSALQKHLSEGELLHLKVKGEFSIPAAEIATRGVLVVGASGSGKSATMKRVLDGLGSNGIPTIVVDGKGEHRGIAWKYKWNTYNFVQDSQARELKLSLFTTTAAESDDLLADLLEEYALQSGWPFSSEQRARLASVVRKVITESGLNPTLERVISEASKESDLAEVSKKMARNLLGGNASRIFGGYSDIDLSGSVLFDLSGRGLRSPTSREEREIASVLLLKRLVSSSVTERLLVLEDILDRLKSPNLQRDVTAILQKLRETKNTFVLSGRTSLRMFAAGSRPIEVVHRLAGQQAIEQEIQGLNVQYSKNMLKNQISFFPRGYCLVARNGRPNLVRVKPVQFS
jgi:hypothetical protein